MSNQCRLISGQIAAREPRDAAQIPIPIPIFSRLKPLTHSALTLSQCECDNDSCWVGFEILGNLVEGTFFCKFYLYRRGVWNAVPISLYLFPLENYFYFYFKNLIIIINYKVDIPVFYFKTYLNSKKLRGQNYNSELWINNLSYCIEILKKIIVASLGKNAGLRIGSPRRLWGW